MASADPEDTQLLRQKFQTVSLVFTVPFILSASYRARARDLIHEFRLQPHPSLTWSSKELLCRGGPRACQIITQGEAITGKANFRMCHHISAN